ncbi:MAG: hypothetical protein K2X72_19245 [Reyranella sp.]|nr:hypothetical protein [Reyranella sp.]
MNSRPIADTARPASLSDVRKIFGNLEDDAIAEILALKPTLADLEDAAICMAGDHDVLAKSGHHVPLIAAQIVELLSDKEEEPHR